MKETPLFNECGSYVGYLMKGEIDHKDLLDRALSEYDLKINTITTGYFRWGISSEDVNLRCLYSSKPGKGAFLATVGFV